MDKIVRFQSAPKSTNIIQSQQPGRMVRFVPLEHELRGVRGQKNNKLGYQIHQTSILELQQQKNSHVHPRAF